MSRMDRPHPEHEQPLKVKLDRALGLAIEQDPFLTGTVGPDLVKRLQWTQQALKNSPEVRDVLTAVPHPDLRDYQLEVSSFDSVTDEATPGDAALRLLKATYDVLTERFGRSDVTSSSAFHGVNQYLEGRIRSAS